MKLNSLLTSHTKINLKRVVSITYKTQNYKNKSSGYKNKQCFSDFTVKAY